VRRARDPADWLLDKFKMSDEQIETRTQYHSNLTTLLVA
jgi:hypothetical protein